MGVHTGMNLGPDTLKAAFPLFLVQVVIIWTIGSILGALFRRIKQPAVVAQILTGILLGPTALGNIPGWQATLFPLTSLAPIQMIGQLGLMFFVFLVGLELDLEHVKKIGIRPVVVATTSISCGIIFAIPLAYIFNSPQYYTASTPSFIFFMGVILGISALPIMARILHERGLSGTYFASYLMACKTVNDLEAWPLLALSLMAYAGESTNMLYMIPIIIGDVLVLFLVLKPLMAKVTSYVKLGETGDLPQWYILFVAILLMTFAFATETCGVTGIVGSIELGFIMPRQHPRILKLLHQKLEDTVVMILLPLFFAYSGLKTNILQLNDGIAWALTLLIIAAAFITMMFGSTLTSWLMGLNFRDSAAVGVLMVTKGLVALIALNYGLEAKMITTKYFSMCAIMIIFTTAGVVPILNCFHKAPVFEKDVSSTSESQLHDTSANRADQEQAALGRRDKRFLMCPQDANDTVPLWLVTRMLAGENDVVVQVQPPESLHVELADPNRAPVTVHQLSTAGDQSLTQQAMQFIQQGVPDVLVLPLKTTDGQQPHLLTALLQPPTHATNTAQVWLAVVASQRVIIGLTSVVMGVSADVDVSNLVTWLREQNISLTFVALDATEQTAALISRLTESGYGLHAGIPDGETPVDAIARLAHHGMAMVAVRPEQLQDLEATSTNTAAALLAAVPCTVFLAPTTVTNDVQANIASFELTITGTV